MAQQTAVEWLQKQLECFGNKHELQMSWATVDELLKQAKEMEKEQIIDAHDNGYIDGANKKNTTAEQYYNETYRNK